MRDILKAIRVEEEPFFISNLKVYPVVAEEVLEENPVVLQQALDEGGVSVRETGSVDSVELDYDWDDPLFVLDGEELIGARQNRMFITSMLLRRGRRRVPVACVEEGRWSGEGEFRLSGYIAFPRLRSINAQAVTKSLRTRKAFSTDQGSIWKEVTRKLESLKVQSQTKAMTESFKAASQRLNPYQDFTPLENQVGFFVYSNLRFLAADIFGSPQLFKAYAPKLLQSYGLDAIEDAEGGKKEKAPEPSHLLEMVSSKEPDVVQQGVDMGQEWRMVLRKFVLKALILRKIVHLSIFPK